MKITTTVETTFPMRIGEQLRIRMPRSGKLWRVYTIIAGPVGKENGGEFVATVEQGGGQ
jgi:hypothetical protein